MKKIAIIGSGIVGSATGKGLIVKGHKVIFYDIKKEVIKTLKKQKLDARLADSLDVKESDAFFLVVPTPTENEKINLKYMEEAARNLGKKLKNKQDYFLVVIRSTVLPGTTENKIIPILEKESGKKAGQDFGVVMNPEYLREKKAESDFKNPWIITIGALDRRSGRFAAEIYKDFSCPIYQVALGEAEAQKYVHNLFNAVKIAFFNEMRMACWQINIEPNQIFKIAAESAEGSWNKKYGIFDRGPFDGMCLPKDTRAFSSWSKKLKIKMDILDGAINSNKKFEFFWKKHKKNK